MNIAPLRIIRAVPAGDVPSTDPEVVLLQRSPSSLLSPSPSSTLRFGFSLIELVVVLVLMAIIASLATTTVRGAIVRQRLARAAEVVEQFDTDLRRSARSRRRSIHGQIDRSASRLIVDPLDESARSYPMPARVAIDSVRIGRSAADTLPMQITVDGQGIGGSYAIRLVSGDAARWVLIMGGSGQVIDAADPTSIDSIMGTR